MTSTSKKFNDLRMYLKQPKRKDYYSEVKKKIDRKQHAHSVFYDPKENSQIDDDPFILKMRTDHSESKDGTRTSKSGYKQYRKEKELKATNKSSGHKMNLNMIKSINKHLINNR